MEGEKIGIEKGKVEGRAEGAKEAKTETAKNLINIGLSVEQISLATGLSVEEIKFILKNSN